MEFGVALMLILLGMLNLRATFRSVETVAETCCPQHAHQHGDYIHDHRHSHDREDTLPPARLDRIFGRLKFYQALRPLVIGTVHGLAGSAAPA